MIYGIDYIGGVSFHESDIIRRSISCEESKHLRETSPGQGVWAQDASGGWKYWCSERMWRYSTTSLERPEHCPICAERGLLHLFDRIALVSADGILETLV